MKVHKDWIGSKKPAAKGDLADLQEDIHVDLQQFTTKQDLRETEDRIKKELKRELMSKELGKVILDRLDSMDKSLKQLVDLPRRVTNLENENFKLKLHRR